MNLTYYVIYKISINRVYRVTNNPLSQSFVRWYNSSFHITKNYDGIDNCLHLTTAFWTFRNNIYG